MAPPTTTTYLIFDVAGTSCAVSRETVREILPLPHLHTPPSAGGPIAGFLNLGGAPLPVLDLAQLLGLRDEADLDPYRHILLSADGGIGLLVDRVVDVVEVDRNAIGSVESGQTLNGCVEAEVALGGRLIHALSMERILSGEERLRVAAHTRLAAERLAALGTASA